MAFFQPPEWWPHACCWMAWPQPHTWGAGWQQAESAYAQVANAISGCEPVKMLVAPERHAAAKRLLDGQVELLEFSYDDAWLRDTAPVFVFAESGALHALDWNFNGWGDKFRPWNADRRLAARLAEHLEIPVQRARITAEGGAMHVNGQGVLLTTRQCLQHENRNPGSSQADLDAELCRLTGAEQVLWLAQGLVDDHTDGHIDELACFVAADRLLLLDTADRADANYPIFQHARQQLVEFANRHSKRLEIIAVPQPQARYSNGVRLSLSYINYYLANDAVIVPSFAQPARDADALAILAEQFPTRRMLACPALAIAVGGGGIHCITQQQPLRRAEPRA